MLRIYPVSLSLCRAAVPHCRAIARHDPDLARQMRRALTSIPLNIAEGMYARGKNRPLRYHTAMGSAREALACLEVAVAMGYADHVDDNLRAQFDHVIGTLVRLCL